MSQPAALPVSIALTSVLVILLEGVRVAAAGSVQSSCLLQGRRAVEATSSSCTPPTPNATDYMLPAGLPDVPPGKPLILLVGFFDALGPEASQFESGIEIHITSLIMTSFWNCAASYHDSWKDGFLPGRPIISTTPNSLSGINLYNSDTRTLCFLQGVPTLFATILPSGVAPVLGFLSQVGISASATHSFDADIEACMSLADEAEGGTCLNDLAACNNYHPEVVGTIVMRYTIRYALSDGWNLDGSLGVDGQKCTANCARYRDTTGYVPRNHPGTSWWQFYRNKLWQPLLEDDDRGYYFRQEHVTPHIGKTAKGRVLTREEIEQRCANSPRYDYHREGVLVLERLRELAANDTLKMLVEFMDDKTAIARTVLGVLLQTFPQQMKIEDVALFFTGYIAAEHDAVVVVWKEKVSYDRVRTTTAIQRWGRYNVTTYGGPYQGVKTFQAKDFIPYIRVMPHSEYPSGSSCICTAAYEYTEEWQKHFVQSSSPLQFPLFFPAGSSKVEPGATPRENLTIVLPDFRTLRDVCASTRLDGGMHFTAAVPAGIELCEGIGARAAQYVRHLAGDATAPVGGIPTS